MKNGKNKCIKMHRILAIIAIVAVIGLSLAGCPSHNNGWPSNINDTVWKNSASTYGVAFMSDGNKLTILNATGGMSLRKIEYTLKNASNNGKIEVTDSTGTVQTFCERYTIENNKITIFGGLPNGGSNRSLTLNRYSGSL